MDPTVQTRIKLAEFCLQ